MQLFGTINYRPVLKWPGGKQRLLAQIIPFVPKSYNHYIEPFFGGGSLFFALKPKQAIVGDLNFDLINFYVQLRDNVEPLIKHLEKL